MYCGHSYNGYCEITDDEITNSVHFPEHNKEFSDWGHNNGTPDWDKAKNAYHIRYLAEIMYKAGRWLGRPVKISISKERYGQIMDGNHRIRAIEYLKRCKGVTIIARVELVL